MKKLTKKFRGEIMAALTTTLDGARGAEYAIGYERNFPNGARAEGPADWSTMPELEAGDTVTVTVVLDMKGQRKVRVKAPTKDRLCFDQVPLGDGNTMYVRRPQPSAKPKRRKAKKH